MRNEGTTIHSEGDEERVSRHSMIQHTPDIRAMCVLAVRIYWMSYPVTFHQWQGVWVNGRQESGNLVYVIMTIENKFSPTPTHTARPSLAHMNITTSISTAWRYVVVYLMEESAGKQYTIFFQLNNKIFTDIRIIIGMSSRVLVARWFSRYI